MSARYHHIIERTTESGLFYAWAVTLVVACTMGFINGIGRGGWWAMSLLWGLFFLVIPIIEFALVHKAMTFVRSRMWGAAGGAVLAALLAFVVSVWSTFNTASVNQDQKIQARLAADEQQTDGKDAVNRAAAKYMSEKQAVEALRFAANFRTEINGVAITTPQAAQAMVAQLEGHRFFRLSNNCQQARGRQTTDHCRDLAAARAAKASAEDAMLRKEELRSAEASFKKAEADLAAARAARANGPVVASTQSPFVKKAGYYFGMPEEDANTIESGLPALGLQILTMMLACFISAGIRRDDDEQPTTGFVRGNAPTAETAAPVPAGVNTHTTTTVEKMVGIMPVRGSNGAMTARAVLAT